MMNDLPTVFEVVNETAQTTQKEKSTVSNHSSTKSTSNSKPPPPTEEEEEEGLDDEEDEDDDEDIENLCGSCGGRYYTDEFWICCDICEKWFHGKCVKITPARAEKIKQYKCPYCRNKRSQL